MTDHMLEASLDKTENVAMRKLLQYAAENSGVFGEHAHESITVHLSGRTCDYRTKTDKLCTETDPIMRFVEQSDAMRIKRMRTGRRCADVESCRDHLIVTLEVDA